ncbi:MAG: cytochrome c maturation protein CcmE [Gammaproteobacteria bacterium]|nr:cytochrome c maturation protein CcmE [Gammaproteobacteria bacterium]
MKPRHKRLAFIVGGLVAIAIAATLVLKALEGNLAYFFSPSDIVANKAPVDHTMRLGGLVKKGTVKREGLTVRFDVTDNAETVSVSYTGILPDLFQEGQGVVAQGRMRSDGVFHAEEVLAKHDETYMPPEVAAALEKAEQANSSVAQPAL